MDKPTASLEYGTRPRSRWPYILAAAGILLSIFAAAWYLRTSIEAFIAPRYAQWRFSRTFDRADNELTAHTGIWLASAGPTPASDRADQQLAGLLALSPPDIAAYRASAISNRVLFIRSGKTGARRWLAFACVSGTGLEMYTFERDDRMAAGYDRPWETRAYWLSPSVNINVDRVQEHGPHVHIDMNFNGGANAVSWSIQPTSAPAVDCNASGLVTSRVVPETGWLRVNVPGLAGDWWPNTTGCRLIEGHAVSQELPTATGIVALAFVSDGRLAAVARGMIKLITVGARKTRSFALPVESNRSDVFSFSPDGSELFIGGASTPTWLVDSLSGRARQFAKWSRGMPAVAFPDNYSFILLDNVTRARVDWETMQSTTLDVAGGRSAFGFGSSGHLIAVQGQWPDALLVDIRSGTVIRKFKQLQGLHHLSLSPDGHWLAMKGQEGLRLFAAGSGSIIWDHDIDNDLHTAGSPIKWSADGMRGAAAGNRYVYVWSLREPRWIARFPHGRTGYRPDVALSPDGRSMAASAAGSSTIGYWPDIDTAVKEPAINP